MNTHKEIEKQLLTIFSQRLNLEIPSNNTDLLSTGLLDSLTLVELLVHLEQSFGVQVSVDDLEMDNFRTIDSIATYIGQRCMVEVAA
jgi:acyl carrier protein